MIEIIIPVEKYSDQLDRTVASVEATVPNLNLKIMHEPSLNVAECRELAIQESKSQYLCFLDYDSVMIMPGWLDAMLKLLLEKPDAGAVFIQEWWGSESFGTTLHDRATTGIEQVRYGPSACMLIDKSRIPDTVHWDPYIGLTNGWLGGDAEEVAWQYELKYQTGCNFYRLNEWYFHHEGGKKFIADYLKTDRQKTCTAMCLLLRYKYNKCPQDKDFFKQLHYLKASITDDTMLAGGSVRECFKDVVANNGLQNRLSLKKRGLA